MVPGEETPQEDNADGSAMAEDNKGFHSDAGVSFTAVLPKPILIPAPVCYERSPSGLEKSKTSKHNTKPTFTTYPFYLMFITPMFFT